MAVMRAEMTRRELVADGAPFGAAGAYERITGTVYFAVDPAHPANASIADVHLAPHGADGCVHFSADFVLRRPVDQQRANGRLLFDVLNRGTETARRFFDNGASDADSGPDFLMRQGYTVVSCGWQHDVPVGTMTMALFPPEALEDGTPLSGVVMCDFQAVQPSAVLQLPDRGPRVATEQSPSAVLTVREDINAPRRTIPRDQWEFARADAGGPTTEFNTIRLRDGFAPGKIYELVYTAQGAPVVGLGLAAVRDFVSWLRYGDATSGNPCAGALHTTYGFGVSQSGHFLRHFLYLGLNEDDGLGLLPPSETYLQIRTWHALNSVDFSPLVRAALVNLDRWVSAGVEPPNSRYPRIDDGTAVTPESALAEFAAVPEAHVPAHPPALPRFDFGPDANEGVVTTLPPGAGPPYPHLVSAVDHDGNEIAGVRLPNVAVPLATFTGWNVRHPDAGAAGEVILRAGSTLRFARTKAERGETGDPRPSIEERYVSKKEYLREVRDVAVRLTQDRYLLAEDVDPAVARAALRWDLYAKPS